MSTPTLESRVLGCIIGGAIGDALGALVEFLSIKEIRERIGKKGVTGYVADPPAFTDDTQMTLFAGEGLIRASLEDKEKGDVNWLEHQREAYWRWLSTQEKLPAGLPAPNGWLVEQPILNRRRDPGMTCLSSLRQATRSGLAKNDSKGCGTVMRTAPFALLGRRKGARLAHQAAAVTHGHPAAHTSSALMSATLSGLFLGETIRTAYRNARGVVLQDLSLQDTHTQDYMEQAFELGNCEPRAAVGELGEGWIAEEALAISLFATMVTKDFSSAVLRAVNHSGDSDSTGAIAGNLMGAIVGLEGIPNVFLKELEGGELVASLAGDLVSEFVSDKDSDWPAGRYPLGG